MSGQSILIFAKTPYARTPYDKWLAGSGIDPIILTPKEFAEGYRHMPRVCAFADYDRNRLVEKTALQIARGSPLVGIFARAEADVIRAAELRELLGLPGQKTASAVAYRDKVVMKNHLRDAGIALPEYRALSSAYDAIQFVEKYSYPVVIKPRCESGSTGTHIIRDEAEFDRFLAHDWRDGMEIETFVEGQMYHIDGLVVAGRIVFIHPSQYLNDCLSFRKNEYVGSYAVSPQNPVYEPLLVATRKIVAALPAAPHMAFHAELWRRKDGKLVFCEIASRTGGGLINSMIEHGFHFNIDKEWLYAECGLPRPLTFADYRPTGFALIPPLNGVLTRLPRGSEPDYVRETQLTGAVGERFHGGVKSGLFLAGYVVGGESEDAVKQNVSGVAAWFAAQAEWQLDS